MARFDDRLEFFLPLNWMLAHDTTDLARMSGIFPIAFFLIGSGTVNRKVAGATNAIKMASVREQTMISR